MRTVNDIINEFISYSANPAKTINDYRKKTEKGVVGIMPVYCPEEIVHASGCLPVGIWGAPKTTIAKAHAAWPPFACSVAQTITELEKNDVYNNLDAVIFSVPCDTLKCLSQKWDSTKVPSIVFTHPQNRKDSYNASNVFAMEEYKIVKEKLEGILGVTITTDAIRKSIVVYNENRAVCREFSDVCAQYAGLITPSQRHAVFKARWFMEKSAHTALVKELIEAIKAQPVPEFKGKKIIVSGIMTEPEEILEIFEKNGFAIVADDLAQESRQVREDVPYNTDPLLGLAKQWNNFDGCSLAIDEVKPKGRILVDAVKKYGADAVVICLMKFCEPEEFDYPILLQDFEPEGIKSLFVEIDLESTSFEQFKTRVQTFAEIL